MHCQPIETSGGKKMGKKKEDEEEIIEKKVEKKKPKKKAAEEIGEIKKKKSAKKKKELKIADEEDEGAEEDIEEPIEEEEEEEPEKKKEKKEKPKPDWYTDDEHTRNWMMLANATYIGSIITYISTKDRKGLDMEMIKFQVIQGLFSNILLLLFFPAYLVFALIAVFKAKDGECWEMPGFGGLARTALGMEIKEKMEEDDEE